MRRNDTRRIQSNLKAVMAYFLAIGLALQPTVELLAETPTAASGATTTPSISSTPLNATPIPTGTISPEQRQELAAQARYRARMEKDPELETKSRIKFHKRNEDITKAAEEEIKKIEENNDLSEPQKQAQIADVNKRKDEAIKGAKEQFARDMGFKNYAEAQKMGVQDPSQERIEKGGSSSTTLIAKTSHINPAMYLEYLTVISAGLFGPSILSGCFSSGPCPTVSHYIWGIGLVAYILGEVTYMLMYKEASSKALNVNTDGDFDQQLQNMKKAADVTEQAAKAAKIKAAILQLAAVTMLVSLVVVLSEMLTYSAGPQAIVLGKCMGQDLICVPVASLENPPGGIPDPFFQDKMRTYFAKNTQEDMFLKKLTAYMNVNTNLFKGQLNKAETSYEAYQVFREWGQTLNQQPSFIFESAGTLAKLDNEASKLLQDLDIDLEKSGYSIKDIFTLAMDFHALSFSSQFSNFWLPKAEAGDDNTGLIASLGISGAIFALLAVTNESLHPALASAIANPGARAAVIGVIAGMATVSAQTSTVAAIELDGHARKYKKVKKKLEALKNVESQAMEEMAKDRSVGNITNSQNYNSLGDLDPKDYANMPRYCFVGKTQPKVTQECQKCVDNKTCYKPKSVDVKKGMVEFPNISDFAGLVAQKTTGTIEGISSGDLSKVSANTSGAGKLAVRANKLVSKFKDAVDENYYKKNNLPPLDKQIESFKGSLLKKVAKSAKNVDLKKELAGLVAPNPLSEKSTDNEDSSTPQNEQNSVNPVPAVSVPKFGLNGLDKLEEEETPAPEELQNTVVSDEFEMDPDADVNKDPGVSIFKVLSVRYIKSALPQLLSKQEEAEAPAASASKVEDQVQRAPVSEALAPILDAEQVPNTGPAADPGAP